MALDWTNASRMKWKIAGAWSRDDQQLRIEFTAAMRAGSSDADRKLFQEVFGRVDVEKQEVAAYFEAALNTAAAKATRVLDAAFWLSDAGRKQLCDSLHGAVDGLAFGSGMEVLPPLELEVTSPTLQQARVEEAQRRLAESRAAGRLEHAQRAISLLEQFEAARKAHPELAAGQLLSQFGPADQGIALEAMLMADVPEGLQTLWVVSGEHLLKITPPALAASPRSAVRRPAGGHGELSIESFADCRELGPARSVSGINIENRRWLLVGAQQGVMRVDAASAEERFIHRDNGGTWTMGFNSIVILGEVLWGCHAQAGLVGWKVDAASQPCSTIRPGELDQPAASDRTGNLTKLNEGTALFSVGTALWRLEWDGKAAPLKVAGQSPAVGIVDEQETIAAVFEGGEVIRLDRTTLEVMGRVDLGRKITAAGGLPWMGGVRLLVAREDGPIQCIGRDDLLTSQYLGSYRSARVVIGGRGWVAAVAGDRQRIGLWHGWEGACPLAERSITAMTQHRIAAAAFW